MVANRWWIIGNFFVLFSCVVLSHQGVLLNTIDKHGTHKEAQNILDPSVHQFDPKWLKTIDYDFWLSSLESPTRNRNAHQLADSLNRMFDVPRIMEEIVGNTPSKVICFGCQFLANLVHHMFSLNKTNEEVLQHGAFLCTELKIQKARVCEGTMKLIGVDVVEATKETTMTPAQICSFFFQDSCLGGYDSKHDWHVTLPSSPKLQQHMTTPPAENVPRLKVLQITDTHFDRYYLEGSNADCGEPMCCRATNGMATSNEIAAGKWGDYRECDSPKILIENAFKHIVETHKDIDYIIWTGDLPPHDIWNQTREGNLADLYESVKLMDEYFPHVPIYPTVGNHESCPVDGFVPESGPSKKNMTWLYEELHKEWARWLPPSTTATIRRGAYYSLLIRPGFRIIAVNGNFCERSNIWLVKNSTDPAGELAWLIKELDKAESKGEKVHIIGHVPPGGDDCHRIWSKNYNDIVDRYEAIIMAQFFGHSHFDEFEVFYDKEDLTRPINVGYIAPSITPYSEVNPAYRIYYVDGDHAKTTRAILDHETWKMDLDKANKNGNPIWVKSYTAREAYNMTSLLPKDWDSLIDRMSKDKNVFDLYHRNYYRDSPVRSTCDDKCWKDLVCYARSSRSQDKLNMCKYLQVNVTVVL